MVRHTWQGTRQTPRADIEENRRDVSQDDTMQPRTDKGRDNDKTSLLSRDPAETKATKGALGTSLKCVSLLCSSKFLCDLRAIKAYKHVAL
jgi:hypothetical protein